MHEVHEGAEVLVGQRVEEEGVEVEDRALADVAVAPLGELLVVGTGADEDLVVRDPEVDGLLARGVL